MAEETNITKAVRLDTDLAAQCEQWCEANESDFSKLSRLALRAFLARKGRLRKRQPALER